MTVLEVIQRSSDFLARKGVDSPRLQVELLLAHVLQMPRMKLYLNFERPLTDPELETLRQLVKRRGERVPLQHLVGATSFCGLEIAVNREVLVPRPETELLAEEAWKFLLGLDGGNATAEFPSPRPSSPNAGGENPSDFVRALGPVTADGAPSSRSARTGFHAEQELGAPATGQGGAVPAPVVLDFGTGSGCLALAIAVKCPQAIVHAIDISEAALTVARDNLLRLGLAERVCFHAGDGFRALPDEMGFDLIVSNPPYIPSAEIETLQPEVRDHDPRPALDGGADGLDFYRRLAAEAGSRLKPGGKLMLEHGDEQGLAVSKLLAQHGWTVERAIPDYSGRGRILIARRGD